MIIIDDGSTDATSEIVDQYFDVQSINVIHQNNKGFSGVRNTGLRLLDSKCVMFLDSDDLLEEDTIEKLLSEAYQIDADVVEGSFTRISEDGVKGCLVKRRDGEINAFEDLRGQP